MLGLGTIGFIIDIGGAILKGGAIAASGSLGARSGKSIAKITESVLDYVWLNAENGYLKDHPERQDESVPKRIWRIFTND